jgi:hypothetical protein
VLHKQSADTPELLLLNCVSAQLCAMAGRKNLGTRHAACGHHLHQYNAMLHSPILLKNCPKSGTTAYPEGAPASASKAGRSGRWQRPATHFANSVRAHRERRTSPEAQDLFDIAGSLSEYGAFYALRMEDRCVARNHTAVLRNLARHAGKCIALGLF